MALQTRPRPPSSPPFSPVPARRLTKFGLLLFCALQIAFANMAEVPFAVEFKYVAYKQIFNGMYPPMAYVLAATVVHIPIAALESGVFAGASRAARCRASQCQACCNVGSALGEDMCAHVAESAYTRPTRRTSYAPVCHATPRSRYPRSCARLAYHALALPSLTPHRSDSVLHGEPCSRRGPLVRLLGHALHRGPGCVAGSHETCTS